MFKLTKLKGILEGTYTGEITAAGVINCKTGQQSVWIDFITKEHYHRRFYILTDCSLMYKLLDIAYEKYNIGESLDEKDFVGMNIGIVTKFTNNSDYSSIIDIFPIEVPPVAPAEVEMIEEVNI